MARKRSNHLVNMHCAIQPVLLASPIAPVGAPFNNDGFSRARGNISIVGIYEHTAGRCTADSCDHFTLFCTAQLTNVVLFLCSNNLAQCLANYETTFINTKNVVWWNKLLPRFTERRDLRIEKYLSTFVLSKPAALWMDTDSA